VSLHTPGEPAPSDQNPPEESEPTPPQQFEPTPPQQFEPTPPQQHEPKPPEEFEQPTRFVTQVSRGPKDEPEKKKRHTKALIEWGIILAVALLAAVLLRAFVVQPYFIPSGSMEPTLHINDKVLVNKLSYDFHSVHRGDIIVFSKPGNDFSPGIKDLIKRVIGLPGETISGQDGAVFINGVKLKEPWLPKGSVTDSFSPVHIPSGYYFVMGDNRGDSADSRVFGPIPKHLIIGRAFLRVWPLSRLGFL
jgi:signal peptidase I